MEKRKEQKARWKRDNRDKENAYRIKSLYGITVEEKYNMLLSQNNRCKICKTPFIKEKKALMPHIDHDHATGKVRGLLCDYCNRGLGAFKDKIANLLRAILYLLASR